MGRYACFSTGIEYKFAFATQCSSDITTFGGTALECSEGGRGKHEWQAGDKEGIVKALEAMQAEKTWLVHDKDVDDFAASSEGTWDLLQYLERVRVPGQQPTDQDPAHWLRMLDAILGAQHPYEMGVQSKFRYVLGKVILHQLSYAALPLCVDYEW